jgi:hypothetical protein
LSGLAFYTIFRYSIVSAPVNKLDRGLELIDTQTTIEPRKGSGITPPLESKARITFTVASGHGDFKNPKKWLL